MLLASPDVRHPDAKIVRQIAAHQHAHVPGAIGPITDTRALFFQLQRVTLAAVGYPCFAALRAYRTSGSALTLSLLVFACSVYELPAGSGHDLSVGGSAPEAGGADASGAMSGNDSDAGTATAGGSAGKTGNMGSGARPSAGSGGSTVVEPNGGEGGAPGGPDECPQDPDKLEPGDCGCGVPDAPSPSHADCGTLQSLLSHRYDFEGTGTVVKDRVGVAHGTIARGATLSQLNGKGVVLLGGGSGGAYVDLPDKLLSPLTNSTLEAWVTWGGGGRWQRIFDFGDSSNGSPENPDMGKTYLFLSPSAGDTGVALVGYSLAGNSPEAEVRALSKGPLAQSLSHVAVVADDAGDKLLLYVNGALAGEQAWTGSLAAINDVNVWLGRSQFNGDVELSAVFHEFRIYKAALNAQQIAASFNAGPDPDFLAY